MQADDIEHSSDKINKDETISLFKILLVISNAKDLFTLSREVAPDENWDQNQDIQNIKRSLENIVQVLIKSIGRQFYDKAVETTVKIQKAGLGNAMSLAKEILKNIKEFSEKMSDRLKGLNFLEYPMLGKQLFHIFLKNHKKKYLECIEKTRQSRKLNEKNNNIEDELLAFESDEDVINLSLPLSAIKKELDTIAKSSDELAKKYHLNDLVKAFHAFNELLNVNQRVLEHQMSKDEIEHLSSIITDYFNDNKQDYYSADIAKAILSIEKIKPIYRIELKDLENLLDGRFLWTKTMFIKQNIFDPKSNVKDTFEGIALVANAYLLIKNILNKVIEKLKNEIKNKPDLKSKLEHFINLIEKKYLDDHLTYYYQLGMRYVMPVQEFSSSCKEVKNQMKAKLSPDNGLYQDLENLIETLDLCNALLVQKTKAINALTDITGYINNISKLLRDENQSKRISSSFFITTNYTDILKEIFAYFSQISQSSRIEDYTNFQGIHKKLDELFHRYKLDKLKTKDASKSPHVEALLIEIYKRYDKIAKEFQEDVNPAPVQKNG